MKKWITESELCNRWATNVHNIREWALNGNLQPFKHDHTHFIIYDGGTAIELPDGTFATNTAPATANDVADCIYLVSNVEEFERENGLTPFIPPTDPSQQSLTKNPLDDHAQEKIGEDKIIPPPPAANFFTRVNLSNWRIGFDRQEAPIQHLLGLQYIGYLLEKPGKSISCRELYQGASCQIPDKVMSEGAAISKGLNIGGSKQATDTRKASKICREEYQELEEKLLDAGLEEQEDIQEKMAALIPYMTLKERNIPDSNDVKAQAAVKKALDRAYEAIGKAKMKDLAKYLKAHIKPDGGFGLSYTGKATWEITL